MITKLKSLRHEYGFMRYFKNTSWLLGEKFLRMFVGLFVGVWVARYLGPEQFGLLSYAQSFVFLFTAFSTLGLDGIVVRELVKDESKRDVLLGSAFSLKLIGAILILPVLAVAVQWTQNDNDTNLLVFIIASSTIFQSFNVIDFYYQSKVLSKYVALANTVSLALSSIIKIALILNDAPLVFFALMTTIDMIVLALGLIYYYKKSNHLNFLNWNFDWYIAKILLKDSWPLLFSGLVISLYMRVDQLMIKEILNADAVGQYAAAVRLSEVWYFIPMVIVNSLFPALMSAKKNSEKLYYLRLQRLYTLILRLAVVVVVPMIFLSDWIIIALYGVNYSQAGNVLAIHIYGLIPVGFGVILGRFYTIENFGVDNFIRNIIGLLINVILNFYFIDKYGISGAALSSVIAYLYISVIHSAIRKKTRRNFVCMVRSVVGL